MGKSPPDRLSGPDSKYWEKAFDLAEEALHELEVPVGCVLVHYDAEHAEGEIIGRGNNETNRYQ
jgi:tRNA(Arg) A34 adenosine deaminase TadA